MMAAGQPEQWASEGNLWKIILEETRKILEEVLKTHELDQKVKWTEYRWDAPDLTASWSAPDPTHNIHIWVEGTWPAYRLNLEGSAWQDNEEGRRVVFIPGDAVSVRVEGSRQQPDVEVDEIKDKLYQKADEIEDKLHRKVREVINANPQESRELYALLPKPVSQETGGDP